MLNVLCCSSKLCREKFASLMYKHSMYSSYYVAETDHKQLIDALLLFTNGIQMLYL